MSTLLSEAAGAGRGGFDLPRIYTYEQRRAVEALGHGDIDYAGMAKWQFPDEFLCFALESGFFPFVDRTYPSPRQKQEVPIWFLISCQLLLRLHPRGRYHELRHFLNSASILTRFGFNVENAGAIGFNQKNRSERKTAVDADTVRKFFKDSDPLEIRSWYNEALQGWFRGKRTFDSKGLFILDQTHLVVPDNPNYQGVAYLPVDEHGQWYDGWDHLSEEQRKALPRHPCYGLSLLLHVDDGVAAAAAKDRALEEDRCSSEKEDEGRLFHIAGYELGPGTEDELVQAERLIEAFCRAKPSVMKELIMDRGYLHGEWMGKLKREYGVDALIPLKSSMSNFQDALSIAEREGQWQRTEYHLGIGDKVLKETYTARVSDMDLWQKCPLKLDIYVSKTKRWSERKQVDEEYVWALAATRRYPSEHAALARYRLRTQIEERNRQLKLAWHIAQFPSPAQGLVESHVCFTLLTYSLLQLYLRRRDLRDQTRKTIIKLQSREQLNKGAVIVYSGKNYGVVNLPEYSGILMDLDPAAKAKIKSMKATPDGGMYRDE